MTTASMILDSVVFGSTKADAIEIVYTDNWDPYFLRLWYNGEPEDLGYFPTWEACIYEVSNYSADPFFDDADIEGVACRVGGTQEGATFIDFVDIEDYSHDSNYKVILLENMKEPEWKRRSSLPRP